jgi:enoyl-CoA hydratase
VLCDVQDKVAVVTLNAPSKLNALSAAMGDELRSVLDGIDFTKVGAIVVTGAGRAFSAGGSRTWCHRT